MNRRLRKQLAEQVGYRAGDEVSLTQQAELVANLRLALSAQQGCAVTTIETHISFVLVCDDRAYKIKKALRTPFLDQSTLALRERACLEELRLNRRLAAELYLAAVPIAGTPAKPVLAGQGAPIDFAVEMRAFDQQGLWDQLAARGELGRAQIDELLDVLVPFHASARVAERSARWGTPAQVRAPLLQSLDELETLLDAHLRKGQLHSQSDAVSGRGILHQLRLWEAEAFEQLAPLMAQRLDQGRVRECHGDLHLGNVTCIDGRTTVFDGIEFNEDFRWIDVISELAFMAMDLHAHGLTPLANRLVNGYLERSGDYAGVPLLNYYLVHRALVRAKVGLLRAAQHASVNESASESANESATAESAAAEDRASAQSYLELASRWARHRRAGACGVLMLTHGFSGSGKSTLTQGLLEAAGAIRIRADLERKRLAGLRPLDHEGAQSCPGLYGPQMNAATYAQLTLLAEPVLRSGYHVILDATFLRRAQRDQARQFARQQGVHCWILDFEADAEVLRNRLAERAARGGDPSDADATVLASQMLTAQPLAADEIASVFRCKPLPATAGNEVQADWTLLLRQLAPE